MTGKKNRITLRDIAEELGISHSTVSRALRGSPLISEAVRIRVQQKAEAMGYRPDPMLSALAKYRLQHEERPTAAPLAWINIQPDPHTVRNSPEFSLYLKGAETAAAELGFQLEQFSITDFRPDRLNTILKTRGIRGLLLSPPDYSNPVDWQDFPWQDYAAVRFGRSETVPKTHFVTSAQTTNAMTAYDAIKARGYKRIGLITRHRRRRLFGPGFYWAQYSEEDEQIPLLTIPWELNAGEKEQRFETWLEKHRPDAVLSDTELNLPDILARIGLRIPEDIAAAATSIHASGIDAGIDQNPEAIGRTALSMLASQLSQNRFGIPEIRSEILIEGRWVDGSMLPHKK
jgi:DNA-binding LacI/PurR family transcriptional regulator